MRIFQMMIVCVLMGGPFAYAAEGNLKGLRSVVLTIGELDTTTQDCGITKELIRNAFMFLASPTRLRVSEQMDALQAMIYIQVTTIRRNIECTSNINVDLRSAAYVKLPSLSQPGLYVVVPWHDHGILVSSDIDNHPTMVRKAIENATKKFLIEWTVGNKPE